MTPAKKSGTVERVIESGREAEEFALEAVRKFLDTVDGAFPDVGREGPRRKIIDSAFKMTEQLVETWTQLAETIPDVIRERRRLRPPRRVGARKVTAKKVTAKKATAKKAAKRTTGKVAKRAPAEEGCEADHPQGCQARSSPEGCEPDHPQGRQARCLRRRLRSGLRLPRNRGHGFKPALLPADQR